MGECGITDLDFIIPIQPETILIKRKMRSVLMPRLLKEVGDMPILFKDSPNRPDQTLTPSVWMILSCGI